MNAIPHPTTPQVEAIAAARQAIWRLFEQGYVDEDMATAGLLAVDLGARRTRARPIGCTHQPQHAAERLHAAAA